MVKMKKRPVLNILLATFFLYFFLVSIKLLEKGIKSDLQGVEENIIGRDEKDSTRAVSPLKPAPDAITIDTTKMTMKEKDALAWKYVQKAQAKFGASVEEL